MCKCADKLACNWVFTLSEGKIANVCDSSNVKYDEQNEPHTYYLAYANDCDDGHELSHKQKLFSIQIENWRETFKSHAI